MTDWSWQQPVKAFVSDVFYPVIIKLNVLFGKPGLSKHTQFIKDNKLISQLADSHFWSSYKGLCGHIRVNMHTYNYSRYNMIELVPDDDTQQFNLMSRQKPTKLAGYNIMQTFFDGKETWVRIFGSDHSHIVLWQSMKFLAYYCSNI